MVVWPFQQLLSGFIANGHLPRVSPQSRLSANDKGYNEIGGCAPIHGIRPTAKENLGKPLPGDSLMKVVLPVSTSNRIPYFLYITAERRGLEREHQTYLQMLSR